MNEIWITENRCSCFVKKVDDCKCFLGRILNATQDLLWEEEFDASKEDALSYFHPCAEIINTLGLKQKKYDGYYYNESDVLTAFDTDLTKQKAGLIIRKEAFLCNCLLLHTALFQYQIIRQHLMTER